MSVTVINPVIKEKIARASKPPINEALKIIKADNVEETTIRGWSRFKSGIETKKDTDHSGRVFVNDNKVGGKATNHQIGGWQHFGTPSHGPKTAKAMVWFKNFASTPIFAKWVMGITAQNWWGLKESTKETVRELLHKFFKV